MNTIKKLKTAGYFVLFTLLSLESFAQKEVVTNKSGTLEHYKGGSEIEHFFSTQEPQFEPPRYRQSSLESSLIESLSPSKSPTRVGLDRLNRELSDLKLELRITQLKVKNETKARQDAKIKMEEYSDYLISVFNKQNQYNMDVLNQIKAINHPLYNQYIKQHNYSPGKSNELIMSDFLGLEKVFRKRNILIVSILKDLQDSKTLAEQENTTLNKTLTQQRLLVKKLLLTQNTDKQTLAYQKNQLTILQKELASLSQIQRQTSNQLKSNRANIFDKKRALKLANVNIITLNKELDSSYQNFNQAQAKHQKVLNQSKLANIKQEATNQQEIVRIKAIVATKQQQQKNTQIQLSKLHSIFKQYQEDSELSHRKSLTQLAKSKTKIAKQKQALKLANDNIKTLSQTLTTSKEKQTQAQQKITNLQNQTPKTQKANKTQQANSVKTINTLKSALVTAKAKNTQQQAKNQEEIVRIKATITAEKQQHENTQIEFAKLKDNFRLFQTRNKEIQLKESSKLAASKGKIAASQQALKLANDKIKNLNQTLIISKENQTQAQQQITNLQNQTSKTQKANKTQQTNSVKTINTLKSALVTAKAKNTQQQAKNQQEIIRIKAVVATKQQQQKNTQIEFAQLKDNFRLVQTRNKEIQLKESSKLAASKEKIAASQQALKLANNKIKSLSKTVETAKTKKIKDQQEIVRIKATITAEKQQQKNTQIEFAQLKASFRLSQANNKKTQLKESSKLADSKEKIVASQQALRLANDNLKALSYELNLSNQKINKIQKQHQQVLEQAKQTIAQEKVKSQQTQNLLTSSKQQVEKLVINIKQLNKNQSNPNDLAHIKELAAKNKELAAKNQQANQDIKQAKAENKKTQSTNLAKIKELNEKNKADKQALSDAKIELSTLDKGINIITRRQINQSIENKKILNAAQEKLSKSKQNNDQSIQKLNQKINQLKQEKQTQILLIDELKIRNINHSARITNLTEKTKLLDKKAATIETLNQKLNQKINQLKQEKQTQILLADELKIRNTNHSGRITNLTEKTKLLDKKAAIIETLNQKINQLKQEKQTQTLLADELKIRNTNHSARITNLTEKTKLLDKKAAIIETLNQKINQLKQEKQTQTLLFNKLEAENSNNLEKVSQLIQQSKSNDKTEQVKELQSQLSYLGSKMITNRSTIAAQYQLKIQNLKQTIKGLRYQLQSSDSF